jgi:hypothetical protein
MIMGKLFPYQIINKSNSISKNWPIVIDFGHNEAKMTIKDKF